MWEQAKVDIEITAQAQGNRTIQDLADLYFKHADNYYRHVVTKEPTSQARNVRYGLADLVKLHGGPVTGHPIPA